MREACSPYSEDEKCVLCLARGPEGETALRRPRRRGDDNIKMDEQQVVWGRGWVDLALWCDFVQAVINLFPQHTFIFFAGGGAVNSL